MRRGSIRSFHLALALVVASCGGHGTAMAPEALHRDVPASFKIVVPERPQPSGVRPKYISYGTQSGSLVLNSQAPLGLDLSASSPDCVPAPNGRACTFDITAPLGGDTFTLSAYDGPLVSGQPTGKLLSTATTQANIMVGQANAVVITLDGVIASMSMAISNPIVYWDRSQTMLSVTAFDATNNTIVGTYTSEIGLTASPKSPVGPYNFFGIENSSETATLVDGFGGRTIDGTPVITAKTKYDGATVTAKLEVPPQVQHATFILSNPGGGLWVSTPIDRALQPEEIIPLSFGQGTKSPTGVTFAPSTDVYVSDAGLDAIDIFLAGTQLSDHPIGYIEGASTGIADPTGIAADATNIYLLMPASIAVFNQSEIGDVAPTAVVGGSNTGLSAANCIAVQGNIVYVLLGSADEIEEFPTDSSGNVAPTAVIAGSNTGLNSPAGLALDAAGEILVANKGGSSVEIFGPSANGDVAPSRVISGSATMLGQPFAVGVDGTGTIWVADATANLVLEFASNANGNAVPTGQAEIADNAIQVSTSMTVWP